MTNRILDTLGTVLFFAMVPFMPITVIAMYIIMDRLGLVL
jgi:ABC-type maltose transport system permease subunit